MTNHKTIAQHVAVAERTPPAVAESVHYPDSDGHFLPAHPLQARAIVNVRFALQLHFDQVDNVVLEGDVFMYYEEGNPAASIAPDVFVVLEHDLGDRGVYKLWEEGKPPDFALDVISPSSEIRNTLQKRALYARLGIGEYFLFQPDPRKRGRRLVGYRLWGGSYEEVPADPEGALRSTALGVSLRVEGKNLRLHSLESGQEYWWVEEQGQIAAAAQAKLDAVQAATNAAQADANAARAKTEAARAIVAAEVEARLRIEARNAELEALLRERRHQDTRDH